MKCADCGRQTRIQIEMAPGTDGVPWWLCSECWRQGILGPRREITVQPAVALEFEPEPEPESAKTDTGNFDRVPRKKSGKRAAR